MPTEKISETQIKKINLLDKFSEITQRKYNPYEITEIRKGPWKKGAGKAFDESSVAGSPIEDLERAGWFRNVPWSEYEDLWEDKALFVEKFGEREEYRDLISRMPDVVVTHPDSPTLQQTNEQLRPPEMKAFKPGSRPVRGHKTSLKKMGLKGQPKPELAMTEERVENRLYGQVISTILRSEGKKVPSFDKFLSDNQPEQFKSNNPIHRQRLIDLYGEKEGRKFWKADVEAEEEIWKKKQKEIWKYAKEYEKRAATKDTKKAKK